MMVGSETSTQLIVLSKCLKYYCVYEIIQWTYNQSICFYVVDFGPFTYLVTAFL